MTGIDQSERLITFARAAFPDERWIVASLEDCAIEGEFGAIIAWDSLFHIDRNRQPDILRKAIARLLPGGRLMRTVGGSAHPPFTDQMLGRTFFYDSHPPETTREVLERAGLEIVRFELVNRPDGGRDKGRLGVVARKPA